VRRGLGRTLAAGLAAGLAAAAAAAALDPVFGLAAMLGSFALIPGIWGGLTEGRRTGLTLALAASGGLLLAHAAFVLVKPRAPLWFAHWIGAGFLAAGLVYGRSLGSWRRAALGAVAGWMSVRLGALTQTEQARLHELFGRPGVYAPIALSFALCMEVLRRWTAGRQRRKG
jgi:hypothetical protein